MNIRALANVVILGSIALLFSCGSDKLTGGNGSNIGNAAVDGILYNNDHSVAAGVTVHIRKKTSLANPATLAKTSLYTDSASVTTDANGKYAIDSVASGTYVIEGSDNNNNLTLIDSVVITNPAITKHLPPDTLRPAGAIKGVVHLSEGGDPRKVFVLAFGIDRFTTVDSLGNFIFTKLARGNYTLRIISTLDEYGVFDTANVSVHVSDTTNLGIINLLYTGIPTPTGVSVTYDTLNGIAKVRWNKVSYSNLRGYLVYRNDTNATIPVCISGNSALSDTFFFDPIFNNPLDTHTYVYQYRVKVQDNNAAIGAVYSSTATVTAVSPTAVRTFTSLSASASINDTIRLMDTVKLLLTYNNATRNNSSISWYIDRTDSLATRKNIVAKSGTDTLKYAWQTTGIKNVYVTVMDAAGTTWKDTLPLTVINDIPIADAGNDTSVYMNAAYSLHGTASQKFGSIVKWEWNINNTGFRRTASGDTTITTPVTDTTGYPCILRITDDRGNISLDTILLDIGKWEYVGSSAFTPNGIVQTSLAMQDSIPYVVYASKNYQGYGYVMNYTNRTWSTVGSGAATLDTCGSPQITLINSVPYVAYGNYNQLAVSKYNGTAWQLVGPANFTSGKAFSVSISSNNNLPYVAFQDAANSYKTTVMSYNGSSWVVVGSRGFSPAIAQRHSLVFDSNIPYVAFINGSTTPMVMKYTGSAWVTVGVISATASSISFTIDNGTPYLAYVSSSNAITVLKYSGSTWGTLGTPGFASTQKVPSLKVINGTPYIAFSDNNNSGKSTVMKYNNVTWVNVGAMDISADEISLSAGNGIPYVSFKPYEGAASVMRLK